ncbi:MAG: hypothetical protein ACSLFE_00085 [Gemmatimonadaceae bacterium]
MPPFTPNQYDALERAVLDARRIVIRRRGSEFSVIPQRVDGTGGRERLDAIHPTTGETMKFFLDEIDSFEVVW